MLCKEIKNLYVLNFKPQKKSGTGLFRIAAKIPHISKIPEIFGL